MTTLSVCSLCTKHDCVGKECRLRSIAFQNRCFNYRPQRSWGKVIFSHPPGPGTPRTRHTPPGTRHLSPSPDQAPPPRRRACWEIQSTRRQSCLNRFYFINGQLRKTMERNTSTSRRNSNVGGLQSPKNSSLNHLRIRPRRFPFL